MAVLAWHQQKEREGIRDLSREAIVGHVRDRFWQQDRSPARVQGREASLERTIAREYTRTGHKRHQAPDVERTPTRTRRLLRSWGQGHSLDDTPQGEGVRVKLRDREHDYEREF